LPFYSKREIRDNQRLLYQERERERERERKGTAKLSAARVSLGMFRSIEEGLFG